MTSATTAHDPNATRGSAFLARNWLARLQVIGVMAVLAMPSLWMLATVPPLWRDHDAYNQLTRNPARTAESGHGALYSVAVRVPLFIGYQAERLAGRAVPASRNIFIETPLTDTGVGLLLVVQHAGFWAAACALIVHAARHWWLRIALALLFTVNPIFYTFAHCTGSESLSQLLLLVVATVGLRIVTSGDKLSPQLWLTFGLTLSAAMLTRHANLLLAFALPFALVIPTSTRPMKRASRLSLVALLVGIASIVTARLATTALCELGGRDYYPRIGFTFLWRLPFLNDLPEPARTKVLDRAVANARTEDARMMVALLRQMLQENVPLEKGTIMPRSREMFLQTERKGIVKRHQFALNEMARAFLTPPSPELLAAAQRDFSRAHKMPLAETPLSLFMTTKFFFDHRAELPLLAPLRTYRDQTPESLLAIYDGHAYLRSLGSATLNLALAASLIIAAALVVRRRKDLESVRVAAFSASLIAMALGMIAATCLVGELLPRYTLPLWVLLWAGLIMTIGEFGRSAGRLASQVKLPSEPSSLPPENVSRPGSARGPS